jgi:hypothetical protein
VKFGAGPRQRESLFSPALDDLRHDWTKIGGQLDDEHRCEVHVCGCLPKAMPIITMRNIAYKDCQFPAQDLLHFTVNQLLADTEERPVWSSHYSIFFQL